MKLTLRTLLAYLDDRLSPVNAREVGQKLAKSPFATELARRIGDVMRRRRLASEAAQQKTIDANLVAEYLDDQLTPELVALIEKEILSSDPALAEVAAAHQILGLLSDPVEIDEPLRARLHKLDPAKSTEPETIPAAADSETTAAEWKPLERQAESSKRSPMILLVVMVVGWLALLATDPGLIVSSDVGELPPQITDDDNLVANADAVPDPNDSPPNNSELTNIASDTNQPQPGAENASGSTAQTATTAAAAAPAAGTVAAGNDPESAAESTEVTSRIPSEMSETAVAARIPDVTANNVPPSATPSESEPPVEKAATVPTHIELIDRDAIVVLEDQPNAAWVWASNLGIEPTASWTKELSRRFAAISSPFSARLVAPNAGWSLQLTGPCVFRVVHGDVDGLQLLEGRLLLRRYATEGPRTVRLLAGQRTIDVPVPALGNLVAIQVTPLPVAADSSEPAEQSSSLLPVANSCLVSIIAAEADVPIRVSPQEEPVIIPRGTEWRWTTSSDLSTAGAVSRTNSVPEWVFDAANPPSELEEKLTRETAIALQRSSSVSDAALSLLDNRNPRIAAYAVRQLTVIRSVNNLVTTLLQNNEETTRIEAIIGLQKMARETAGGPSRIRQALETRMPEMELDTTMRLIEGFSPVAAEDRETSAWLVSMLSNNRAAVRALAIFNLEQLTNERNGFFANDDSGRRDTAVRRWTRHLERNDGRLIASPE